MLERLRTIQKKENIELLIPCLDAELPSIIKLQSALKQIGIQTFIPSQEQLRLRNKDQLPKLAEFAGIKCPDIKPITSPRFFETCEDDKDAFSEAKVAIQIVYRVENIVIENHSANMLEDQQLTIDLVDLFGSNYTNVVLNKLRTVGNLNKQDSENYVFTPLDNWNGTTFVDYQILIDDILVQNGVITISVANQNDQPVANNDSFELTANTSITTSNVISNDSDIDKDKLRIIGHTQGSHGSVIYHNDGTFTYTPNAGYVGDDFFEYTLDDFHNGSNIGTVNLTVIPEPAKKPTPPVEIRVNNISISTADRKVTIALQPITAPESETILTYQTVDESAISNVDFSEINGTLTWSPGDSSEKELIITLLKDEFVENKSFNVDISISHKASDDVETNNVTINIDETQQSESSGSSLEKFTLIILLLLLCVRFQQSVQKRVFPKK